MKKNKMMRLASSLLVAVLLTSSVISGTFAKYVTSDSAEDTARVAKWGVTVLASGNLFGSDYAKYDTSDNSNTITTGVSESVSSDDATDVVAPGTKSDATGLTFKITGKPEVAYEVSAGLNSKTIEDIFLAEGSYGVMVEVIGLNENSNVTGLYVESTPGEYTVTTGSTWESTVTYYELHDEANVAADGYYPVNWSVAATGKLAGGSAISGKNLDDIATAMVTAIEALSGNANDAALNNTGYVLTWEWPFASGNDEADTILGNLAVSGVKVVKKNGTGYTSALVEGIDYNLEIVFGLDVTVTQVD